MPQKKKKRLTWERFHPFSKPTQHLVLCLHQVPAVPRFIHQINASQNRQRPAHPERVARVRGLVDPSLEPRRLAHNQPLARRFLVQEPSPRLTLLERCTVLTGSLDHRPLVLHRLCTHQSQRRNRTVRNPAMGLLVRVLPKPIVVALALADEIGGRVAVHAGPVVQDVGDGGGAVDEAHIRLVVGRGGDEAA